MATIGELKIHITTCGIPELEHLLAMLEANVENLPTIVVRAMTALAESVGVESKKHEVGIGPVEVYVSGGADTAAICNAISPRQFRVGK
jgi:hypothetical protein